MLLVYLLTDSNFSNNHVMFSITVPLKRIVLLDFIHRLVSQEQTNKQTNKNTIRLILIHHRQNPTKVLLKPRTSTILESCPIYQYMTSSRRNPSVFMNVAT